MELRWLFILLIFAAVFFAVEALYLGVFRRYGEGRRVNRRMGLAARSEAQALVLEQLKRERWISADDPGGYGRRLVVQSGLRLNRAKLLVFAFSCSFVCLGVGALTSFNPLYIIGAAAGCALFGFLVLYIARKRRIAKFGMQLPDAIDIMVRSLRAGHPIPVSLALVAKEMADPAGSEFGMTADEITYGSDLQAAMRNLERRVGHDDLLLVVVAVSIQSTTGGNLAEVLSKLSRVIRERFKMRRKVKALSAEGRFSGIAMTVLPFLVFGAVNLLSPKFYGDVWSSPLIMPGFALAGFLLISGAAIMYKMVNFKI